MFELAVDGGLSFLIVAVIGVLCCVLSTPAIAMVRLKSFCGGDDAAIAGMASVEIAKPANTQMRLRMMFMIVALMCSAAEPATRPMRCTGTAREGVKVLQFSRAVLPQSVRWGCTTVHEIALHGGARRRRF
jgi:hypothetical protein